MYADEAVRELRRRGFHAQRLEDGYPEWKRAGLPVAVGSRRHDDARTICSSISRRCATQVRDKYREVAVDPHGTFHFHTGRPLAARLGYDQAVVDALPDRAVESFAGVGNPFSLRRLRAGRAGRRRRLRRRVRLVHRRRPGRSDRAASSAST